MKIKFAFSAALVLLTGLGLAFAGTPAKTAAAPAVKEDAKTREYKDILFKLVRQDEYLDEALETFDAAKGRMSAHDLSAMGLSLKMIADNLNRVSALNKAEFAAAQPGSAYAKYTTTIFSYSSKVNRKTARVGAVIAQLAAKYKKSDLRDAVAAKRTGKKARGSKLLQLLEEQKAMESLTADLKTLRAASRGVNATSKWLYISTK